MRAAILLESWAGHSDQAIAGAHHVHRNTVLPCINKRLRCGVDAALGELPRAGKPRQLSDDAIAWVLHGACQKPSDDAIAWVLHGACQKPKDLGYSHELWT